MHAVNKLSPIPRLNAADLRYGAPPRPVLRQKRAESATARETGGGEGDLDHQLLGRFQHQALATPAHLVRQITLTLTLSRSTGRGNRNREQFATGEANAPKSG